MRDCAAGMWVVPRLGATCRPSFERRRDRADASNKFRIYISELHVRCHYPAAWREGEAAARRVNPTSRPPTFSGRPFFVSTLSSDVPITCFVQKNQRGLE